MLTYADVCCRCESEAPAIAAVQAVERTVEESAAEFVARLCVCGELAEAGDLQQLQYGCVCSRMLTYAHVCSHMPTYAHVCSHMLTYAHVCSRMLMYAHVCSLMLTYADVCSRMLTYAHAC
jgi:hypothetical protein